MLIPTTGFCSLEQQENSKLISIKPANVKSEFLMVVMFKVLILNAQLQNLMRGDWYLLGIDYKDIQLWT